MESEIPELEDFSDIITISKTLKPVKPVIESQKPETVIVQKNEKTVLNKSDFGGLKKGFLSNGLAEKTNKNKKSNKEIFLKANPNNTKSSLIFEEVQQQNKKDRWLTDDLLNTVSEDSELSSWLSDPKSVVILSDFEKNPQAAILKYKDDKQTGKMLSKFGHLLGNHFSQLVSDEPIRDPSEVIIPGYEPNKPAEIRSALDNKVDQALATSGVREALLDPQVQQIIDGLRTDPGSAQRLIKAASPDTHAKLRLLVESGVLGLQQ